MTFHPYTDAVEVVTEDGEIYIKINGASTYQEGEYTNERNADYHIKITEETANKIIEDLEKAVS
jgi:hypothetical protein